MNQICASFVFSNRQICGKIQLEDVKKPLVYGGKSNGYYKYLSPWRL